MFARTSVLKSVSSFPRPTRQGWFYLLALLGIVIGAINYGNNLGLLLSFIFAGACAASLLQTWSLTRSLTVRFTGAAPVFRGGRSGIRLHPDGSRCRSQSEGRLPWRPHRGVCSAGFAVLFPGAVRRQSKARLVPAGAFAGPYELSAGNIRNASVAGKQGRMPGLSQTL